jgi:hypothetical protein
LGFSKRPLRGNIAGEKRPGFFGPKKFGSHGRAPMVGAKKIKKMEGQTGRIGSPGLPLSSNAMRGKSPAH